MSIFAYGALQTQTQTQQSRLAQYTQVYMVSITCQPFLVYSQQNQPKYDGTASRAFAIHLLRQRVLISMHALVLSTSHTELYSCSCGQQPPCPTVQLLQFRGNTHAQQEIEHTSEVQPRQQHSTQVHEQEELSHQSLHAITS